MQEYLTIWDLVLTPIYLIFLGYIARKHRDKFYPRGHKLHSYYLPGLWVKFGGAIFIALIYAYYYKGGDTYNFFRDSRIINSSLSESLNTWFQLLTRQSPDTNPALYPYTSEMSFYKDPSSHTVGAIAAVLGLFNGTTYIPTALLFAYLSYTGIWSMYKIFADLYPKLTKEMAIALLFIPSTIVWGSAIFKDTLCMFGLGWMTYLTFSIFIKKQFSIRNFVLLGLNFYLIVMVKIYIILAFLPALFLWLMMSYTKNIRNTGLRWMANIVISVAIISGFFYFTQQYERELNKYSLERIASTLETTRDWITYASGDEGSTYYIGKMDGSLASFISLFPAGVTVTLFRPFLWEAKKIIVALSALESLIFLFLTLKILVMRNKNLKLLTKDPNILFSLTFALIFAFSVGVSSGNFGALSRYKIPALPFFGVFLAVMLQKQETKSVSASTYRKYQPAM